MGAPSAELRTPGWTIPLSMTAALLVCLGVFAPFAGDSIEDDRFWLAGFGAVWLAVAGGLAIWDGRSRFGPMAAVLYHVAAFAALVFHMVVGVFVLMINTRIAAVLTGVQPAGEGAWVAVFILWTITAGWLALTAGLLRLWQRRSWWVAGIPLGEITLFVALYVLAIAIFPPDATRNWDR